MHIKCEINTFSRFDDYSTFVLFVICLTRNHETSLIIQYNTKKPMYSVTHADNE